MLLASKTGSPRFNAASRTEAAAIAHRAGPAASGP
jgi:hypothetical protein